MSRGKVHLVTSRADIEARCGIRRRSHVEWSTNLTEVTCQRCLDLSKYGRMGLRNVH